jgi:FkbM family methyltransferase
MVYEIIYRRIYTPTFLPLEPDDIVLDIGANIGVFAVYAAGRTRKTVYAFEPLPDNIGFLRRNVEANDLGNVDIQPVAVAEKAGTARLYLSTISGGHRLFDHYRDHKLERYLEVPTTTLQAIMDENHLDKVDFLKMDCEGSEGPIIASTPFDYLKRIRKIAMEFHDDATDLKHDHIENRLRETGFITRLIWDTKSPYGLMYGWRE